MCIHIYYIRAYHDVSLIARTLFIIIIDLHLDGFYTGNSDVVSVAAVLSGIIIVYIGCRGTVGFRVAEMDIEGHFRVDYFFVSICIGDISCYLKISGIVIGVFERSVCSAFLPERVVGNILFCNFTVFRHIE